MQSGDTSLTRTQLARRQDILSATVRVINRDGYHAASVERIAKDAHTTKSTVLYHFKSKDAIYAALVGTIFEDGAKYMAPQILAAGNFRDKLRAYIASNLQYIAEHADRIAALHQIEKNSTRAAFEAGSNRMQNDAPVQWLQQMLCEGQQAGEFDTFDPLTLALVIRSTIDSASSYFVTHPSFDIPTHIQQVVALFDKIVAPVGGNP